MVLNFDQALHIESTILLDDNFLQFYLNNNGNAYMHSFTSYTHIRQNFFFFF